MVLVPSPPPCKSRCPDRTNVDNLHPAWTYHFPNSGRLHHRLQYGSWKEVRHVRGIHHRQDEHSIESNRPRSFAEFMQVLRRVKNFLCLAFDRTVSFTSITGFHQEPNTPYAYHNSVDIYGSFDPYDLPKEGH